jgi:hypothetical protein
MNLWIRLLWVLLTARGRGHLDLPRESSLLTFRVWPHDLDISLHLNNGRYLTLMAMARGVAPPLDAHRERRHGSVSARAPPISEIQA